MAKSTALNREPVQIGGQSYWIKAAYNGSGRMYAYVVGAGQRGKLALGVRESDDTEGCLAACLVALRERFDLTDTDFARRTFDASAIKEPLPPTEVRLWQAIAFHRAYFDRHTASRYTARHDILDHALAQHYGANYERLTVDDFEDDQLHAFVRFLGSRYTPRRSETLSPNTMWNVINTLKGCVYFASHTNSLMGLRNERGKAIHLMLPGPVLRKMRKSEFHKLAGANPDTQTNDKEYWSPSAMAQLLDTLNKRAHTITAPGGVGGAAEDLIKWLVVGLSVPARSKQLMMIDWNPKTSPQISRNFFPGATDWAVQVPDAAWNKHGGVVRVCPTLEACLRRWAGERIVPTIGKSLSDTNRNISVALKRAVAAAGLDMHITARVGRHTMTTWLSGRPDVSERDVKRMCGWSDGDVMGTSYIKAHADTLLTAMQGVQAYWDAVEAELRAMDSQLTLPGTTPK